MILHQWYFVYYRVTVHYAVLTWVDQRYKVCFIFHEVQGCCMDDYEVYLLLFLYHSTFQKVIIAFLHMNIKLNSWL